MDVFRLHIEQLLSPYYTIANSAITVDLLLKLVL